MWLCGSNNFGSVEVAACASASAALAFTESIKCYANICVSTFLFDHLSALHPAERLIHRSPLVLVGSESSTSFRIEISQLSAALARALSYAFNFLALAIQQLFKRC